MILMRVILILKMIELGINKKVEDDDFDIIDEEDTKEIKIIGTLDEINKRKEENKYTPRREVFSSVYSEPKNS